MASYEMPIANERLKCPHCGDTFNHSPNLYVINQKQHDKKGCWTVKNFLCPTCNNIIIFLICNKYDAFDREKIGEEKFLVYPKGVNRPPLPQEVKDANKSVAEDYMEACLVLSDSEKASATLSRRCLQNLLREIAKVKPSNLESEIQEIIDNKSLPSYLSESLDAVRVIGNFAAHPIKSKSTGEIVPVEKGEAEWQLDVLERLFDFYFVQPNIINQKRNNLNKKLQDAGKPQLK